MPRFGDETTTGRLKTRRGHDRLTIAARAESSDGFGWWPKWLNEFAASTGLARKEPKSENVLPIADLNPVAKRRLLDSVGPCRVFVMSIAENTSRLIQGFRQVNPHIFEGRDSLEVLQIVAKAKNCPDLRQFAYHLKELAVNESAVGSLEHFLNFDNGLSRALHAGFPTKGSEHKFDRVALRDMSLKDLETFAGRFAMVVADALSPEKQAASIRESLSVSRMFMKDAWIGVVEETMRPSYIFDPPASEQVGDAVEAAHQQVESFLHDARHGRVLDTMQAGRIEHEDSRNVWGIQVADIAAAVASNIIEASEKPTREAALELRNYFAGVFLNHDWL